ncbi:MAG TPA: alternative oxidase [Candidatus Obscuribacterales bacterium]
MIKLLVSVLVFVINTVYRHRPIPRFYVLETVARVPYFAYLSVLHLYETMGLWRRKDWLKVHFAESWNELHHLLIMENLGGNTHWIDRFLAQHVALIYYWIVVTLYLIYPSSAYNFMELVEGHAYNTYDKFLKEHELELKAAPAPEVAIKYYRDGDLYMFDEFQTTSTLELRRPKIENLYDVFVAIRDDEMEHVKTMVACQAPDAPRSFKSPHSTEVEILLPSEVVEEAAGLVH